MASDPTIHRYPEQSEGAFVNAFLVETDAGVVAIDSLLTVSESRAMRAGLERLGKPLRAVLLTQSHPDHYGGLTELVAGDDVPIVAPQGVIDVIARDDEAKEQILRPMFGSEWATKRTFPNTPVRDAETLTFDDVAFTVIDLGPASPRTTARGCSARRTRRLPRRSDLRPQALLSRRRLLLALARQHRNAPRAVPSDAVFHVGHGGPVDPSAGTGSATYIETFLGAVAAADWANPELAHAAVVAEMTRYLPTDELQFLMELSIEPVAAQLGLHGISHVSAAGE